MSPFHTHDMSGPSMLRHIALCFHNVVNKKLLITAIGDQLGNLMSQVPGRLDMACRKGHMRREDTAILGWN